MSPLAAYVLVDLATSAFAVWIYWDLTAHKVGRVPGAGGLLNIPAGAWAVASLFLWLVTIPLYALARRPLIERARASPVEVENRLGKLVVLSVVAFAPPLMLAGTLLP